MENSPDIAVRISQIAQGNPGALRVLLKFAKEDPMFLNPLGVAMILTNSESWGLWYIYKDIAGYDLEKTKKVLRSWFDGSADSLQAYIKQEYYGYPKDPA
jgi:hypothetical protein